MNPNHDAGGRFASGGGVSLSRSDVAGLTPQVSKIPGALRALASHAMTLWVDGENREYKQVNDALREKSSHTTPAVQSIINGMDALFKHASHSLKQDTALFRGLREAPSFEAGKVYQDNGFQSTSANKYIANAFTPDKGGGAVLSLTVPKGTKVLAPSGKEGNLESEVLLNRGTRFRVVKIEDKTIHAEVVADSGTKMNSNHDAAGRFASGGGGGVHATDKIGAKAVTSKWANESSIDSIAKMYQGVQANKGHLDNVGALVAQETGAVYHSGPIKKVDRVLEKMTAGRRIQDVKDIVRSTFTTTTPEQADAVVKAMAKHLPVTDEGFAATSSGYFDRATNVKFDNGQIGEVLIMPPEMAAVKSESHKLYEGVRNLPTGHPMREVLVQTNRTLIDQKVTSKLSQAWKAVLGSSGS